MITIRPASDRGHRDFGWLDTHHTFSFGDYYDPRLKRANVVGFAAEPRVTFIEGTFTDAPAMQRLFAEHRLTHPLLLVHLLVQHGQAKGPAVEVDGLVEVGHGDADVVDARQEGGGHGAMLSSDQRGCEPREGVTECRSSRGQ